MQEQRLVPLHLMKPPKAWEVSVKKGGGIDGSHGTVKVKEQPISMIKQHWHSFRGSDRLTIIEMGDAYHWPPFSDATKKHT